jgi:hypothetical protein
MNAPGLCRWRYSWHPGGATLPESLRYLVSQSWAAGWSYLLAVTSETADGFGSAPLVSALAGAAPATQAPKTITALASIFVTNWWC